MKHHGEGQKQVVTTANSPPKKTSLLRLREKSIFEYNRRFSPSLIGAAHVKLFQGKKRDLLFTRIRADNLLRGSLCL